MYPHWNYFLTIESDFADALRFVELDRRNYATFSLEFVRLLLTTGSEIDVVCKQICDLHCGGISTGNIGEHRREIIKVFPHISMCEVIVPSEPDPILPWKEWGDNKSPFWWTSHTDVKHKRHISYEEANLKNVMYAVSGLFLLCLYLYRSDAMQGMLPSRPRILSRRQNPGFLMFENGWEIP